MSFDVGPLSQLTFAYSYVVGGQRGGQPFIGWNSCPFYLPLTGADPNALGCEAGVLKTDESKVLRIEFVLSLF